MRKTTPLTIVGQAARLLGTLGQAARLLGTLGQAGRLPYDGENRFIRV
jgi:hypothetical protein